MTIASDTQSGTNPTLKKGEMYEVTRILKSWWWWILADLTFTNNDDTNAFALAAKGNNTAWMERSSNW